MAQSVNLRPAGRKLPSLGVHRSVHGLIGLFLGVSWITNNYGGGQQIVNDLLIQPYIPNESFFALEPPQKVNASKRLL